MTKEHTTDELRSRLKFFAETGCWHESEVRERSQQAVDEIERLRYALQQVKEQSVGWNIFSDRRGLIYSKVREALGH